MKKFLFTIAIMMAAALSVQVKSQSCNLTTPLIKYTSGTGIAPFQIGESPNSIADWEANILGAGTGDATTPFNPPSSSAANFSLDGAGAIGPDLDGPTAPRDLRFFAFTYDNYNVYFYFRRINNSNSQNTFLYLLDINADGYMNDGEPVIRANFNASSVSSFAIHKFQTNNTTDYVASKGNYMTKPTAPNAGLADGYSVNGSFSAAVSLAAFPLQANEIFAAAVTENGFGVEFAVPWRYLRNWTNPSTATPLTPGDVFTYHVSTQNGTGSTVTSGAEDNAGGCCSGLASVGDAKVQTTAVTLTNVLPNLEYLVKIQLKNTGNAPAKVSLDNLNMPAMTNFAGRPVNEQDFVVKAYVDANGNGLVDGTDASTLKTFNYNSGTFASLPIVYLTPTPADTIAIAPGAFGYFLVDIRFPSNYSIKTIDAFFGTTGVLDLPLGPCQKAGVPQNSPIALSVETTLPVVFKSFTAVRNGSTVMLKWETASEFNCAGFAIERLTNGNWEQVGYVATAAPGGNSSSALAYSATDANNYKGVSQYRIRQVDLDNRSKYTDVRSVRGNGQLGKTLVYPNPTNDGKVNVVFEETNVTRDIAVTDMSGRIIKQWKGVTNNNITIDNLTPGMYSIRIVAVETGEQVVEKVVVNKR